ncbi:MAG: nucleoside monophosphate kinase [Minisyncoccia bacterium]
MNSRAVVFFGRSGCGKGTQAKLLADVLRAQSREVLYTETGSQFREFMKTNNYSAKLVGEILKEGGLIPVFLPIWIWTELLVKNYSGTEDMVLDGVCRRMEESVALDSAFDFYKIEKPNIVLINVSEDWSYTRMMERRRADDTPEKIKNRLAWYEKDVLPAVEYFRNRPGYNFVEINGEQPIENVHKDIIKALGF